MPPPATVSVPVIVGGAMVKVVPELVMAFEMERPLNDVAVEVARVIAPVCAEPYV